MEFVFLFINASIIINNKYCNTLGIKVSKLEIFFIIYGVYRSPNMSLNYNYIYHFESFSIILCFNFKKLNGEVLGQQLLGPFWQI